MDTAFRRKTVPYLARRASHDDSPLGNRHPRLDPALPPEKPALAHTFWKATDRIRPTSSAPAAVTPGGPSTGPARGALAERDWTLAFVLDYRVAPYRHPCPILDAQRALRLVRHRARSWRIHPERLAILGFSAGGHLAAIVGTLFGTPWIPPQDPIDKENDRPDALILCYPVISFQEYRHDGSMGNLLGEEPTPEQRQLLSAELQVTPDTPPPSSGIPRPTNPCRSRTACSLPRP